MHPDGSSRSALFAVALAALLGSVTGCAAHAHGHADHHRARHPDAVFVGIQLAAALADLAVTELSRPSAPEMPPAHEWEPPRGWSPPAADPPPPAGPPPPVVTPPLAEPSPAAGRERRFDAAAARAALEELDLGACHDRGVPHGYLRAAATFDGSGGVRSVYVDTPATLPAEARSCVEATVSRATVAHFGGAPVTLRATWFVN